MRILIKNARIVTQNKKRECIPNGFIVIDNNKLEKIVGGEPKLEDIKKSNKIINAKKMAVLPGFVNAHVHLGESVFKDFFKGKYSLENYLKVTNKLTRKMALIEDERKIIADYSLLKLMKQGTATICGGRTVDSSVDWGIRNVSGYMLMNSFKLKIFLTGIEKKFTEEYKKIKNTKLSYPALFIHSLNTVNRASIENAKKILNKYSETKLILHLAETKKQEWEIKNRFGKSSIEFLYQEGLLNNKTILIHGNWINDEDMMLVKKCKTSIVHCLSSNLKVADKTLDLVKMMRNKVKLCIATDGLVTGGTFSILDEAVKCFVYHNNGTKSRSKSLISFQKILDLITIDAAKVLGLGSVIGSIEKGKRADIIFIKKEGAGEETIKEVIKGKHEISGVIIDGEVKIWNNKVLIANEKKVINKFRILTKRIKEVAP